MNSDDQVIRTTLPRRYYAILGKDLICPICGAGSRDVDPDFDLIPSPPLYKVETYWTCVNGHANATTTQRRL